MKPGDSCEFLGGTIIAVAAHHPGGRNSLNAEADGRALGYVIRTENETIYYSGDTDYFEGIADVGERYRPNIALLNVNPHLPSEDALRAFTALGSPRVIPIHSMGYGGPTANANIRRRAEFSALLGTLALPLAVGESLPLGD
jgi:L-ascorbate metabolism protein UlaG (beta-lactamase superfamily)